MCIRDRFNAIDTLIGPFDYDYRSDEISENGLKTGDLVQDVDSAGNDVYRYIGGGVADPVDLNDANFTNTALWERTLKVFATERPAEVRAYVQDTALAVGGDLSVTAFTEAAIDATVSNEATSAAVALYDANALAVGIVLAKNCLLYTSPSPRDRTRSRMPSSA